MNKFMLGLAVIAIALGAAGCNSSASPNVNAANNAQANTNSLTNPGAPVSNSSPAAKLVHTAGSLDTPTDAYLSAYDYRQKKDIEGLKKVMSKDILGFFTDMGKSDNKTADDMLRDMCNAPQAATAEARNEKIDGDHATVEYLDDKGGWATMDFEKVGSEWKLSFPKGERPPAAEGKDSKKAVNK
jgi:hypothetical protein